LLGIAFSTAEGEVYTGGGNSGPTIGGVFTIHEVGIFSKGIGVSTF